MDLDNREDLELNITVKHDEYGDILPEIPEEPGISDMTDGDTLEPIDPETAVTYCPDDTGSDEELVIATDDCQCNSDCSDLECDDCSSEEDLVVDMATEDITTERDPDTNESRILDQVESGIKSEIADISHGTLRLENGTIYDDGGDGDTIGEYSVYKRGEVYIFSLSLNSSDILDNDEIKDSFQEAANNVTSDINKKVAIVYREKSDEDLVPNIESDKDVCPICGDPNCPGCEETECNEDNKKPSRAVSRVIAAISEYEQAMDIISGSSETLSDDQLTAFTARAEKAAEKAQELIDSEEQLTHDQKVSLQRDLDNTLKYYGKPKMTNEAKKYSRVYKYQGMHFRYNYDNYELECIHKNDDGSFEVIDSIGLSRADWDDGAEYWVEYYYNEYIKFDIAEGEAEYNRLLKNIDQDLVKKYKGNYVTVKGTEYKCVDISVYNQLMLKGEVPGQESFEGYSYIDPEDVESVREAENKKPDLSKTEQRNVNRFVKHVLGNSKFESANKYKAFIRVMTSARGYTSNMIKTLEGFADRYVAKAQMKDHKMSCVGKIIDAVNKSNLPDNVIRAIYRLCYDSEANWNKIYEVMFGKNTTAESANLAEGYYEKKKFIKRYKGYKLYSAVNADGDTVYLAFSPEWSTDEPEWEADSLWELEEWCDSSDEDMWDESLKEGNPGKVSVPDSIDNFMMDMCQMYLPDGSFNKYLKHEFTADEIKQLSNIRRAVNKNAMDYSDEDFDEYIHTKVEPKILAMISSTPKGLKEGISITHNDWSLCTGKEYPRGQDKWKFKFYPGGKIKEFEGSYGEAKRLAAKYAADNGYNHIDCQG